MKLTLEPAFVLHTKPYRETSLLIDIFTLNHGRLSILARSARGPRSRFKGCFILFAPLLISCAGKGELLSLSAVEQAGVAYFPTGQRLLNGFYLNELLIRLCQKADPYPNLFSYYQQALHQLQQLENDIQKILRQFEKKLLAELGYGLTLDKDCNGNDVLPERYYVYDATEGTLSGNERDAENAHVFLGHHLLAIENNQFENAEVLASARRLMRFAVGRLLGNYQLKSRELFQ